MWRLFITALCAVAHAVVLPPTVTSPSGNTLTGTIQDAKHVVIFMQENRPYDHYYGKLKGGRGFADRTAPLTPLNEPIWYQHTTSNATGLNPLCGCMACDLQWTTAGAGIRSLLEGLPCAALVPVAKTATPPVNITEGELCSNLIADLMKSTLDHMKISTFLKPSSTCPTALKVAGLASSLPNPSPNTTDGYILPFHLAFNKTAASCMGAPAMGYDPDWYIFNAGKMDKWNSARSPDFGMSHFERRDLPFYYALADAFTFGDHYYQSTFTATCPNREMLFSGSNGLSVPNSGQCMLDDSEPPLTWETMGETLEKAGVSWKLFQEEDNFDDNGFAWFQNFKQAKPGEALYDKGMARTQDFVADFAAAVANDTLPQVSWLVGPARLSEHASNHPADGEDLTARIMKIMADPANAKVFAKTVFILNYDEGGQFFDHLWTPVPPKPEEGVSSVTSDGELTREEHFTVPPGNPIGLGFRVPMMVISPWSRGGYVYSQVTDHTSVLQFLEKRFDVRCDNISPWRRAVTSDLTGALDFANPDFSPWPALPDTSANVNQSKLECLNLPPPTLPVTQSMPTQEPGVRPSRALPYEYDITLTTLSTATGANLTFTVNNIGSAAVVLFMYDRVNTDAIPRKYTAEAGTRVVDVLAFPTGSRYGFSAHGPNGFVRQWAGGVSPSLVPPASECHGTTCTVQGQLCAPGTPGATGGAWCCHRDHWLPNTRFCSQHITAHVRYDVAERRIAVLVENAAADAHLNLTDNAYGTGTLILPAAPAEGPVEHFVDVSASGNWYDLSLASPTDGSAWRFMGRMETGQPSTSDPAVATGKAPTTLPAAGFPVGLEGRPQIYAADAHAPVPEWYRTHEGLKVDLVEQCKHARGKQQVKDLCPEINTQAMREL